MDGDTIDQHIEVKGPVREDQLGQQHHVINSEDDPNVKKANMRKDIVFRFVKKVRI